MTMRGLGFNSYDFDTMTLAELYHRLCIAATRK